MSLKLIFTWRGLILTGLAIALPHTVTAQTNYYWQTIAQNVQTNTAVLGGPEGLAVDPAGNIYIADTLDDSILKATPSGTNYLITTIAGGVEAGTNDGIGTAARFLQPNSVAVKDSSTLFVADTANNEIRELQFNGTSWVVTTIAGFGDPSGGSDDGTNQDAQFSFPTGIAIDSQGNLYVADEDNQIIRIIRPSGINWVTTTIAGQVYNGGQSDGTNLDSQFNYPTGVAVNSDGDVFVADSGNNIIREIVPIGTNWVTTTIAGSLANGVYDYGFLDGTNDAAEFNAPFSVAVDALNNVYVADTYNNAIRKVSPEGTNWVTRVVGGSGSNGGLFPPVDGTNIMAQFYSPDGVAVDLTGNVYVGDTQNNALRVGYLFPPSLQLLLGGNQATLSYPASLGTNFGFILQATTNLQNPVWLDITNQWLLTTNSIPFNVFAVTNKVPSRFFRLQLP